MKLIALAVLATSAAVLGQDQPVVIQTPTDITIHMNAPSGASAGVRTGVSGSVQFVGAQPIGGEAVKGAPYSAEAVTETTQTLADGNRIATSRSSMQYRDGLGRERREESFPQPPGAHGALPQMVIIHDPVANTNFTLFPQTRTATKMPGPTIRPGQAVQFVQTRDASGQPTQGPAVNTGGLAISGGMILNGQDGRVTIKTEDLGSQMVEGVLAKGTRTTHIIPSGQIGNQQEIDTVDERWYSPELQINLVTRHRDPRTGETINRLRDIVRAEPDPALFQIPADYQVTEQPGPKLVPAP
ncbi:MAG: hypothetical protein JO307_26560 [Bryobacterales bacterium]|nr:hypothetical protein [Bryobacterales bacterium]MBV9400846.1 hypothetical protein [Bryobacterales bacterium]